MTDDDRPLALDLFSGIGGFALASEWAGFRTIGFCEVDDFCRRALERNFPGVPVHGDIRTLDAGIVLGWTGGRPVDLVVGGFPCQPFSVAGRQRAAADDRHLWPEMLRLVDQLRPRYVVGENVAGIVRLAADAVVADLEDLGYACRPLCVPAVAVGAPHERQRVWFLASRES